MFFFRQVNLTSEGNIRALKFGVYIASAITVIGIYNFVTKIFLDPCCREHTVGETMLKISEFLSYMAGIGIITLIFLVFAKQILDKLNPRPDISWRAKSESGLNTLFAAILILNFGLLLVAQLPTTLIGCAKCSPDIMSEEERREWEKMKNDINIPIVP